MGNITSISDYILLKTLLICILTKSDYNSLSALDDNNNFVSFYLQKSLIKHSVEQSKVNDCLLLLKVELEATKRIEIS